MPTPRCWPRRATRHVLGTRAGAQLPQRLLRPERRGLERRPAAAREQPPDRLLPRPDAPEPRAPAPAQQRGRSLSASIGLVRKSFMPAASASSRSDDQRGGGQRDDRQRVGRSVGAARAWPRGRPSPASARPSAPRRTGGRASARALHRRDRLRPSLACADVARPIARACATAIIMLTGLSSTISTRAPAQRGRSSRRSVPADAGAARRCAGSGSSAQKRLPSPGRAVDADLAAHQLRQLAADRQAQAGAAEAPRGRLVGLRERLEQARLRRRRRCPGRCPAPRSARRRACRRAPTSMRTPPRAVNFSALVRKLLTDLAQAHRVAAHRGRHAPASTSQSQRQAARVGQRARSRAAATSQQRAQVERRSSRAAACRPRSSTGRGCRR